MLFDTKRETSTHLHIDAPSSRHQQVPAAGPVWLYVGTVIVGLLLIAGFAGLAYSAVMASLAVLIFLAVYKVGDQARRAVLLHRNVDRRDLVMILLTYGLVLGLYRVAFVIIERNDLLLFAFFASGLLIGVGAPIVYTVWYRNRPLATLGLSLGNLPPVAVLALIFAVVQSLPLWGYELPETRSWATLLGMALMVGLFEAIFFRGFIQGRLQASFGTAPAVFGASLFYGLYHVGYGMDLEEALFLAGLGLVYALAYVTAENILVLWPLMTPLGAWFSQLEDRELVGRLPWASLLGFADVLAVMATIIWIAQRRRGTVGRSIDKQFPPISTRATR